MAASPSHVLMLKPPGAHAPDPAVDTLTTLKGWAASICVVGVPADLDENDTLVIRAVSRQFAQEAGFPIPTLLDASLTALCGPGTKESSIKALVRFAGTASRLGECGCGSTLQNELRRTHYPEQLISTVRNTIVTPHGRFRVFIVS